MGRRKRPLSEKRRIYEEQKPSLGIRIDRANFETLHRDSKQAGLKVGEYVESLIEKSSYYIEGIKDDARKAGFEDGHAVGFQEGRASGRREKSEDSYNFGYRVAESYYALKMRCCNCGGEISVEPYHVPYLEQMGWFCKTCDLNRRLGRIP